MSLDIIEGPKVKETIPVDSMPNITDVIDEEVNKDHTEENTKIDKNDFATNTFDVTDKSEDPKKDKPAGPKKEEDKKIEAPPAAQENEDKQGAVVRLMKPDLMMNFYNIVASRIGGIINKANPECLKFSEPDKKDIGLLLGETVKETKWGGISPKVLLFVVLALIIVGKIFTWKKPPAKLEAAQEQVNMAPLIEKYDKLLNTMQANLDETQKQNKILQELMEKKMDREKRHFKKPGEEPNPIYMGYDLRKISFTKSGALVDPAKAGQPGYMANGAKNGAPSAKDKDLKFHWEKWKEFEKSEEFA